MTSLAVLLVLAGLQAVAPELFEPPQMRSAVTTTAPTVAFFGTLAGLTATATLPEPSRHVQLMSGPSRRHLGPVRVLMLVFVAVVALSWASPHQLTSVVAVVLTVAGESLLLATVVGVRYSWLFPAVHVFAAATLGAQTFGTVVWWAWPVKTQADTVDVALSMLIFCAGLAANVRPGRSRPSL